MPINITPNNNGDMKMQFFQQQGGSVFSSIEMHSDGCIYIAYTSTLNPTWYNTYDANEAHNDFSLEAGTSSTQLLPILKHSNVDPKNWQSSSQAFRNGREAAPRCLKICVPLNSTSDSWPENVKGQIPPVAFCRLSMLLPLLFAANICCTCHQLVHRFEPG